MRRGTRLESEGLSEESGSADDEKKAEMVGACGTDEGRPHCQVLACMQAGNAQLVVRNDSGMMCLWMT